MYHGVLIRPSLFSEQKIDGIVLGIDGIKSLLEELNLSTDKQQPEKGFVPHLNRPDSARLLIESQATSTFGGESPWDYSSHIIDFVKAVVGDRGSGEVDGETGEVLSSLKTLVQTLESPPTAQDLHISDTKVLNHQVASSMPPLNTVVVVLRWAKGSLLTINPRHDPFNTSIRTRRVY